jgi:hypothetical protein
MFFSRNAMEPEENNELKGRSENVSIHKIALFYTV